MSKAPSIYTPIVIGIAIILAIFLPLITDIQYTEKEILKYAAMGEKYSNHPIAKSIIKANQENLEEVREFKEISGKGLSYQYNGKMC